MQVIISKKSYFLRCSAFLASFSPSLSFTYKHFLCIIIDDHMSRFAIFCMFVYVCWTGTRTLNIFIYNFDQRKNGLVEFFMSIS